MVTRIKEQENHQVNKDKVPVLDVRLIEEYEHLPFRLFSTALSFQTHSPVFCLLAKIKGADLPLSPG